MKQCVEIDANGYIFSVCPGTSELPSFYNISNKDNLTDDQLLYCTLKKVADGYVPVFDAAKYAAHQEEMKQRDQEMAAQPTPQQEIEKLREEVRMLKEELKGMEPSETQQTLQRALFQAPAFLLAASQQLTDEEAEKMPDKMAAWQPGKTYEKDMVVAHKGALYRIVPQEGVTSQAHQEPGETGMLAVYRPLSPNEGEADGSLEKPFEFVYGMDVVEGLYYLYNEKVYVANQAVDNCIWYPGQAGVYIFALIR